MSENDAKKDDSDDMEIEPVKMPVKGKTIAKNKSQTQERKKKTEVAGTFVSFEKFCEIKWGIFTLTDLLHHTSLSTILTGLVKSQGISVELEKEKKINNDVEDEEEKRIASYSDYIQYTQNSNTVIVTLEKLLRICAMTYAQFNYVRKGLKIALTFVQNSKIINMTMTEIVEDLKLKYKMAGKKLKVQDPIYDGVKVVDSLIIKQRYTQEKGIKVPQHLLSLSFLSVPLKNSTNPYYQDDAIQAVVQQLRDGTGKTIEPTEEPTQLLAGGKVYLGKTIHALDDIVKPTIESDEDIKSLVHAVFRDDAVAVEQDTFEKWMLGLNGQNESQMKEHSLVEDYGVINVGWLTAPKTPNSVADIKLVEIKSKFEKKFSQGAFVFYFVKDPVDFVFVKSTSGRKFTTLSSLDQHLKLLQRLFHYLQLFAAGSREIVKDYTAYATKLFDQIAETTSGRSGANKVRFQNQFIYNYRVWSRSVVITKFGSIKKKNLPTKFSVDDGEQYDEELSVAEIESSSEDDGSDKVEERKKKEKEPEVEEEQEPKDEDNVPDEEKDNNQVLDDADVKEEKDKKEKKKKKSTGVI